MRLLTHNSLKSIAKGIGEGCPLKLEIDEMEVRESEVNLTFIKALIPGLDWEGVLVAAAAVGLQGMPAKFNAAVLEDESFLRAVHNLLLDIHVQKGSLVCPDTGTRYPITDGLPNMMLPEGDL